MYHYAIICSFSDAPSGVHLYHTKDQAYNALDANIDWGFGSGTVQVVQGNFESPHAQGSIKPHGRAFLRTEVRFNEGHRE